MAKSVAQQSDPFSSPEAARAEAVRMLGGDAGAEKIVREAGWSGLFHAGPEPKDWYGVLRALDRDLARLRRAYTAVASDMRTIRELSRGAIAREVERGTAKIGSTIPLLSGLFLQFGDLMRAVGEMPAQTKELQRLLGAAQERRVTAAWVMAALAEDDPRLRQGLGPRLLMLLSVAFGGEKPFDSRVYGVEYTKREEAWKKRGRRRRKYRTDAPRGDAQRGKTRRRPHRKK